jgi:hypothetical protein
MSGLAAFLNIGASAARRVRAAQKPLVRFARRSARRREQIAIEREADSLDRQLAALASGRAPIVAGPWLAEVGYEVLYWIPFLRWWRDTYGIDRRRLVVLSRGGMDALYRDVAGGYLDLFDLAAPEVLARQNPARRAEPGGGGLKQFEAGEVDEILLAAARARLGTGAAPRVCHPSLMFRLFRHVWHGNLPMDWLWRRTRYARTRVALGLPPIVEPAPARFAVVKLYGSHSLRPTAARGEALRALVGGLAARMPVVALDTPPGLDDHADVDLAGIPGVRSAGPLLRARDNLAVQLALVSHAALYVGTCGGLAWLAPFLGVPTVGVFDDDRLLAPHLLVARQAVGRAGAAEFSTLDLRALDRVGTAPPVELVGSTAPAGWWPETGARMLPPSPTPSTGAHSP